MSASQKIMGHVYAIFTILVWGSCFVLTKELLTAYTAVQIIPLRMGLAYLTLWVLRPKTMKLPWKDELMFILIGITGGSFYFFLQNTALTYTYAANVSIIVALSPILTVILAQLFSRSGERLGKFVYIGAVIAIAGVVLVVLNGQLTFHLNPLGDLIALAAAVCWAVYSLLIKRVSDGRYGAVFVTRKVFAYGILTVLPMFYFEPWHIDMGMLRSPSVWGNLLFLGFVASFVCFVTWSWVIKRIGALKATNYVYLNPVTTVLASAVALDEPMTALAFAGSALILLGVFLANTAKTGKQ